MKPIFKQLPESAHQWYKNGDHPNDYTKTHQGFENGELRDFSPEERKANGWEGDVVRYYRDPYHDSNNKCTHCGEFLHVHGWIDDGTKQQSSHGDEVYGQTVCPGDFILEFPGDVYLPVKSNVFENLFLIPSREENL